MQAPIDKSCCFSFDDLFTAARGRPMTDAERAQFSALDQPARNDTVKRLVEQTRGSFTCEDRPWADGVTYTAFWATEAR